MVFAVAKMGAGGGGGAAAGGLGGMAGARAGMKETVPIMLGPNMLRIASAEEARGFRRLAKSRLCCGLFDGGVPVSWFAASPPSVLAGGMGESPDSGILGVLLDAAAAPAEMSRCGAGLAPCLTVVGVEAVEDV